jgi:hypothetical protein
LLVGCYCFRFHVRIGNANITIAPPIAINHCIASISESEIRKEKYTFIKSMVVVSKLMLSVFLNRNFRAGKLTINAKINRSSINSPEFLPKERPINKGDVLFSNGIDKAMSMPKLPNKRIRFFIVIVFLARFLGEKIIG